MSDGTNWNSGMTTDKAATARLPHHIVHARYVRITHWINALATLIMVGSGWQIYNASPLFGFTFPKAITLGGWLAGGLLWHFAAMWLLLMNGAVYVTAGLMTGRLSHGELGRYNTVQKLVYTCVLLTGVVIIASGFALWKPVQLKGLAALFGRYEGARLVHFFAMSVIVLFLVIHVVMTLLVPKSLRAMIRGR